MAQPPAIIPLVGDWSDYLDLIYEHYLDDLIRTVRHLKGKPIRARFNPETQGKGFSFWHVISEGDDEDERLPDPRRCERIRWIAWVLEEAANGAEHILTWNTQRTLRRGTVERLVLFCEEFAYAVILEERVDHFLLVSAYPVSERRARKLRTEWETSQK